MRQIAPIGKLLHVNEHGYLVNDASIDNIVSPWKEACDEAMSIYKRQLGDALHSVYIRGSVPRGLAIPGVSDLDTVVVVFSKANELDYSSMEAKIRDFEQTYDFLSSLDVQFYFYEHILHDKNALNERFVIKTLSTCVYGDDMATQLSPFKVDRTLAQNQCKHLDTAMMNVKQAMSDSVPNEYIHECCQWIMKRIIRAGFALVMEQEQAFTRDLYPAYQIFSKYYPKQQNNMRQALELAINPSQHVEEIIGFIEDFGIWLYKELQTTGLG